MKPKTWWALKSKRSGGLALDYSNCGVFPMLFVQRRFALRRREGFDRDAPNWEAVKVRVRVEVEEVIQKG